MIIKDGIIEAEIFPFGARINSLKVNGADITLGFNSDEDYVNSGCYAGGTIGRLANRITEGKFTLNGKGYALNANDGKNHLHGGYKGFDKKMFTVTEQTDNSVTMEYLSVDGEENYPGNLRLTVKFTVKNNSLLMEYRAVSDKDTLWCPTNHAYFNLDGAGKGDCLGNMLEINADCCTPVDNGLIPTGEKRAVKGTPFDFTKLKKVGEEIGAEELKATIGYDHTYILNSDRAAHAESKITGIRMDVYTDLPCLQFYSGGQLNGVKGKSGVYNKYAGFCLEPQYCPNAVNMQGFDKPVLKAGEEKKHFIVYEFSAGDGKNRIRRHGG